MIPFAIPQDGEVVNISQIIRVHVNRTDKDPLGGEIEVTFSDGLKRIYTGDAARVINLEVHFAINMYRQWQIASQSPLVGSDGKTPARIM